MIKATQQLCQMSIQLSSMWIQYFLCAREGIRGNCLWYSGEYSYLPEKELRSNDAKKDKTQCCYFQPTFLERHDQVTNTVGQMQQRRWAQEAKACRRTALASLLGSGWFLEKIESENKLGWTREGCRERGRQGKEKT